MPSRRAFPPIDRASRVSCRVVVAPSAKPTSNMASKTQMSDSASINLIKEVRKRPCIWDPNDEYYSERYHLSVAWGDISKILNMAEDVLRAKWKNLRDFFKKEVKKNDVETVEDYRGRWRHFKSMGFLLKTGEEKHGTGSEAESEYETKYVPDSNLEVFLQEDPIPEKRYKIEDDDNDYDMMFLKSLTPFLKQLEPTRNLMVRSKIQELLLNELAAQSSAHSGTLKKT
ncbi:hypothetical protein MSG28_004367 [Choristoneura fumiferana]|uniref:Uncharacterized protein n=1 Tax=Choristoneura fumiferana TaxID=7141 RepID=A0ACC0KJ60_CHOFU|nr:hypothetical protein MSG28_004367 [Choristoneura fumiferana]